MNKEEIRQRVVDQMIGRMNGVYDVEYMLQGAEKVVEYIYNGTVPPLPVLPQAPQCPPPSVASATGSTKQIRDYYKRP